MFFFGGDGGIRTRVWNKCGNTHYRHSRLEFSARGGSAFRRRPERMLGDDEMHASVPEAIRDGNAMASFPASLLMTPVIPLADVAGPMDPGS